MSYRDGIRRDIELKRQRDKSAMQERQVQRISDLVPFARNGQISPAKFLEITREILDGDADRIVRVGHEVRPDIQTEEGR